MTQNTRRFLLAFLALLAAATGILAYILLLPTNAPPPTFNMHGEPGGGAAPAGKGLLAWIADSAFASYALAYLVMLVGVVLGTAFRIVRHKRTEDAHNIKPRMILTEIWTAPDLWLGLFGSPIVYGVLMQSIGVLDLKALIITALQNGFFCSTIIGDIAGRWVDGDKGSTHSESVAPGP